MQPDAAFWHEALEEFVLPYDAAQASADPDGALMAFLVSTYEAAADLGGRDHDLLECAHGQPREVRTPDADTIEPSPSGGDGSVEREDGTYSETFPSHDAAFGAARRAACRQLRPDETKGLVWEDATGQWHAELSRAGDRPHAQFIG